MVSSGEDMEEHRPFLDSYRRNENDDTNRIICWFILLLFLIYGLPFLLVLAFEILLDISGGSVLQIDSAMVSISPKKSTNSSSDNISINWTIGISVEYQSKYGARSYEAIGVSVFQNGTYNYNDGDDEDIINHYEATIPPFFLNPGDRTVVTAAGNKGLVSMIADIKNGSGIGIVFNVKIQGRLRSGYRYTLECTDVHVIFTNANEARMVGEPRNCSAVSFRK